MFGRDLIDFSISRSRTRPSYQPALEALEERVAPVGFYATHPDAFLSGMERLYKVRVDHLKKGHKYTVKVDFGDGTSYTLPKPYIACAKGAITFGTFKAYVWQWKVGWDDPDSRAYHWYVTDNSTGKVVREGTKDVQVWSARQFAEWSNHNTGK